MTDDYLSEPEKTIIATTLGISHDTGEMNLHILSGEGAGQQFTFAPGQAVVIGRQDDSHICLNHSLVSRHHSKIEWRGMDPWLMDLKSTNGTIYSGKKIKEVALHQGDRFQIGNSVIKITLKTHKKKNDLSETRIQRLVENAEKLLKRVGEIEKVEDKIFSGNLGKIKLPEILQSLALGSSEGILVIRGLDLGKIYLQEGKVIYAKVGKISGKKALFRILSWKEGTFELRQLEDELIHELSGGKLKSLSSNFEGDITQILLEFFKYQDEFDSLGKKIPSLQTHLRHSTTKILPKKTGYERVYGIYQKVKEKPRVKDLLDEFALIDSEIYRVLIFLIERGFLKEQGKMSSF